MNNTKIGTSLDDTKELIKLILENTELPLVIFAGEESYCGEYAYNLAEVSQFKIEELTFVGEYYIEKSDYKDELYDKLDDEYDTPEKLEHAVENIMNETEFVKAIVIYVG
jgi:hypothetical protein